MFPIGVRNTSLSPEILRHVYEKANGKRPFLEGFKVFREPLERHPDIVLLDDSKARKEASALGLIPVFTSDVLKRAARIGLLASYQDAMHDLAAQEIYLPEGRKPALQ